MILGLEPKILQKGKIKAHRNIWQIFFSCYVVREQLEKMEDRQTWGLMTKLSMVAVPFSPTYLFGPSL